MNKNLKYKYIIIWSILNYDKPINLTAIKRKIWAFSNNWI